MALALFVYGQLSAAEYIDKLKEKYRADSRFQVVEMGNTMLKVAALGADRQTREVIRKIKSMSVIATADTPAGTLLHADAESIPANGGEFLGEETEDGKTVKIYVFFEGETVTDFTILLKGEDGIVMITLVGSFTKEDFEKLEEIGK